MVFFVTNCFIRHFNLNGVILCLFVTVTYKCHINVSVSFGMIGPVKILKV